MATIKISKPEVITVEFDEIEGKVFEIGSITQAVLDGILETEGAIEQAAKLLGCKSSVIKGVDIRSLNEFLEKFLKEVLGGDPPPPEGEN